MSDREGSGRFGGDMDRNEVEIDLSKFMALLQEQSTLKDRIRELEDEGTKNPHQKWIFLPKPWTVGVYFQELFKRLYVFTVLHYLLVHGFRITQF